MVGGSAPDAPTRRTMAALDLTDIGARGAAVPFDEYEAENAVFTGRRIGPDRRFQTLAAEASGRMAVLLSGPDDEVTVTLARAANALTVRTAIPDGADGRGQDATMGIYIGGERIGTLALTSRYGWFYGRYPFTNDPADGQPHHFWDHARLLLDTMLPAGTQVTLKAADGAAWTALDLVDFETVAGPLTPPPEAVSIMNFGADPTGRRSSAHALEQAIAAAQGQGGSVWLPPGRFRVDRHVIVDRVTIAGAGMWYSSLVGRGVGLYGREAPAGSSHVRLQDFAILGEVDERVDDEQVNAIGGAMGDGSSIERLWLQHHKVGLWFDGPMRGIRISGLRILDMTADGLNFHRGVTDVVVEHNFVRNTGDDGLASWAHKQDNADIVFRRNTVIAPVLANGIAVYGGRNIAIEANLVADTVTQGGGLHVGNRFDAVPASGSIRLADNLVIRAGSFDPNWRFGIGAVWFYALDAPMVASLSVFDTDIVAPTLEAVLLTGQSIQTVDLKNLRLTSTRDPMITIRSRGIATAQYIAGKTRKVSLLVCDPAFEFRAFGNQKFYRLPASLCLRDEASLTQIHESSMEASATKPS